MYNLFKRMLGNGAVYAALGNHDSYNQSVIQASKEIQSLNIVNLPEHKMHLMRSDKVLQSNLVGEYHRLMCLVPFLTCVYFRNYDHVASLWEHEGWISSEVASLSRAHYSAYMVNRHDGLRIISLNTDLCESFVSEFFI